MDYIEIKENTHGDKCSKCKAHDKINVYTEDEILCQDCAIKKGLVAVKEETKKEAPSSAKVSYK